jgi:16S rRNA (cytosine967-C5)-methyltransferase
MKVSPARAAAYDVLMRVETERAFTSVLLPVFEEGLGERDKGLCHEIALGVLRRQIYLDRSIDQFSGKKLDAAVRVALRIGLYQLLFLTRIPPHSAINESVNLVQRAKKTSAKGLVNAVLRRATREAVRLEFADEIDRTSVETSHPRWLVERWSSQFGLERAASIAEANNEIPPAAFRATARRRSENFAEGARESRFVAGCFITERFDDRLRAAAERGEIYLQDEGSQMVASAVTVLPGGRFMDVCAAPGGKTGQIAAEVLTRNREPEKLKRQGARLNGASDEEIDRVGESGVEHSFASGGTFIAAGDLHRKRAEFLKANCARQGVGFVSVVQYDAEKELPFEDEAFDAVLVDAPCSGTGTIRHNPELRYFIGPGDPAELNSKQLAILKNASKLVKPGGTLIYSTCSLETEENEGVCSAFEGGFERKTPEVPERFLTAEGFARTFPDRDDMDGFFLAAWGRRF